MASLTSEHNYDRLTQVKQFDESKIGVKGLLDSGITTLPHIFHQPPENLPSPQHENRPKLTVPGITYSTNTDLFKAKAASWRDTMKVWTSPKEPQWEAVPEICWTALKDWDKAVVGVAEEVMSILCEGLGIKSDKLKELSCSEGRLIASHYYPPCPQPELTLGLTCHTDPCVFTMLVQNEVGGLLQVKHGEDWATVEAVRGAFVINIGDLLQ
nr:1-aminocyclopropane-1-carboxylate oxidase homolog 3-like [Tanacetum cinerariifolium]